MVHLHLKEKKNVHEVRECKIAYPRESCTDAYCSGHSMTSISFPFWMYVLLKDLYSCISLPLC